MRNHQEFDKQTPENQLTERNRVLGAAGGGSFLLQQGSKGAPQGTGSGVREWPPTGWFSTGPADKEAPAKIRPSSVPSHLSQQPPHFFFSCFFINLEKEPAPHTQLLEHHEHHRQEEGGAAEEWSSRACQGVSHAERDPSSQALDKTLQGGQKDRSWE